MGGEKSSHNGIVLADLDGRLTYVNDAFLKMWGYDDGEKILGKSAVGFWQKTDRARDIIIGLFDKGNWEGEMVAVKSDGSPFDVHLSASMVSDKSGDPCCLMACFIDITERKRAEKAEKENEQKMRALLNATNNPEVLLAPEGIILALNETAATVFGGRPDEFIGTNIGNFVPEEQYEHMRVQSSNVRATGKPLHLETENNNRIYDTCIYPVFDAEDNATAVAICSID
ncbi:MAG: PAS domain-containing protein, partial [Deltaproteobacteria bacterium]|nr:PAS domain-containing protein [Deltaproteobacteria bacterium]